MKNPHIFVTLFENAEQFGSNPCVPSVAEPFVEAKRNQK